jgi:chromosome segregation ATPase
MAIASVTGLTTITAVIASFAFVFFQLPNIALQQAMATLDARAIKPVGEMNIKLADVLQQFGSIDGRSDEAASRLTAIRTATEEASKQLMELRSNLTTNDTLVTALSKKSQDTTAQMNSLTEKIDSLQRLQETASGKADTLIGKISQLDNDSKIFTERIDFVKNLDWKPIERRLHVILGAAQAENIIVRADEALRGINDIRPRVDKIEEQIKQLNPEVVRLREVPEQMSTQGKRIDGIQETVNGADGNTKLRKDIGSLRSLIKVSDSCIRIGDAQICSGVGKAVRQDGSPFRTGYCEWTLNSPSRNHQW